jgi:rhodanese-related sulfurtransferase
MRSRVLVRLLFALAVPLSTIPALAAADPSVVGAAEVHAALVGSRPVVVVDARTPAEYEQGHIPRAINIPAQQMSASASRLPKDRATPIVFYCRGGG